MPAALDSKPLRAFSPVMAGVRFIWEKAIMKHHENPKHMLIIAIVGTLLALLHFSSHLYTSTINISGVSILLFSLASKYSKKASHNKLYMPLFVISVLIIGVNGVYHYVQ